MKTKLDIILETQAAYADPFNTAFDDSLGKRRCLITTKDGMHCAVGRCMTVEYQQKFINLGGPAVGLGFLHDYMLKPEYHGHSSSFWLDIQRFHDSLAKGDFVRDIIANWERLLDRDDLETLPSLSEQTDLQ